MTLAIHPGDIYWCLYPERERPGRPGPKERPGLTIGWVPAERPSQDPKLVVVYGSSQAHQMLKPWQIVVMLSGQSKPTVFDFRNRILLPCTDQYFPRFRRLDRLDASWEPAVEAALVAAMEADRRENQ